MSVGSRLSTKCILLLCLLALSCSGMPKLCKDYYITKHAREPLENYPIEEQIDIYLCGYRYLHPPNGDHRALARNGVNILPLLLDRLERAEDDNTRWALFLVFRDIGRFQLDLRRHPRVLAALQRSTEQMAAGVLRRGCQRRLAEIREGPIVPPERDDAPQPADDAPRM